MFASLALVLAAMVPPQETPPWRASRAVLVREVEQGLADGAARRAALEGPKAARAWQREARAALRVAFRPHPPAERATPPTHVVRTLERPGYRVQHLLIESRPGMHVTAHLYLPGSTSATEPVPGILVACGHSREGKATELYQRGAATLATHGMAALCFDPLDQGERIQARRPDGAERRWGTSAHNVSGAQALLVGWSQAGLEAWDAVRCVDVLAAHPEVDAERLGVCGNSGGGTQSAQVFAIDERLKAAAPSCYITSLAHIARTIGPQDAEQNLLGQVAHGLDHADYLAVRAPAPALVCAAERDFFPIDGTREAVAAARGVYAVLGAADAVDLATVDAGHGWHPPLIEATTAWMARWLAGREIDAHCVAEPPMTADEARVTPTGQVLDLEGERSVLDVIAAKAAATPPGSARERVERARALCGVRPIDRIPGAAIEGDAGRIRVVLDDGMQLPASRRDGGTGAPVLVVGAGAWSVPDAAREAFGDREVLWVDPLAVADAAPDERAYYGAFGPAARDAAYGILLGRPLLGRQVEQILAVARLCGGDGRGPVDLVAAGPAALAALHAAAFEPELFGAVDVTPGIVSWRELLGETPDTSLLAFVVPGALTAYDLSDLRVVADARR